jgi:hypothetical protein
VDPTGEEAHAACVAANVPPGELALVAFSVHSTGVDQILIRKEWYDTAMSSALSKFPSYVIPQGAGIGNGNDGKNLGQGAGVSQGPSIVPPARLRTPPSEDVGADIAHEKGRPASKPKGGAKGKNVGWKEGEKKSNDSGFMSDSAIALMLAKEIRKSGENLHTQISWMLGKDMDKQREWFFDGFV